jgi:histidine kinase/histidine kinase/DNA gyrase B/HSP90-like ATPase
LIGGHIVRRLGCAVSVDERANTWPRWWAWGGLCAAALLLSLVETGQIYLRSTIGGPPVHLLPTVANALPFWLMLAVLTPLAVKLARRWPLDGGHPAKAVAAHLVGAAVFAVLHALSVTAINVIRFSWPVSPAMAFSKMLSFASVIDVLVYGAIVGATHALRYYDESRERARQAAALRASLVEARLAGLRAQINPHVLFNTLNAVSVLAMKGDTGGVVRVVGLLSEIRRSCLDESRGQEASLADELALVERYLEIQRIRFADRLSIDIDAEPDALKALVPTLVLQPVVENAVTHGIANDPRPGRISISAHRVDGALHLTVTDSGPGFGSSPYRGHGVGLSSVRARLAQLYGEAQTVTIGSGLHGGAAVGIVVPYREA